MQVWINGQFVERDDARISIFDAGYQHAIGLFETMSAHHGRVFRGEAHVLRLVESARELLLSESLRPEPLLEAINTVVTRNNMDTARVRLSVTGGDLNLLQSQGKSAVDPTVLIVAQLPTDYPDSFFEQGVMVLIAEGRSNPFDPMAGHKTLNYWPRIQALQVAGGRRASEALWFTVSNHLEGGSVSNAFILRDEVLCTPVVRGEEQSGAIPSSVRPGITRAAVLECAESMGLETRAMMLDIEDLLGAQEVFLTNSSWGMLPVVRIEREQIGDGAVGSVTTALRERFQRLVDDETGDQTN